MKHKNTLDTIRGFFNCLKLSFVASSLVLALSCNDAKEKSKEEIKIEIINKRIEELEKELEIVQMNPVMTYIPDENWDFTKFDDDTKNYNNKVKWFKDKIQKLINQRTKLQIEKDKEKGKHTYDITGDFKTK